MVLTECLASTVTVVSSNGSAGPSPRNKISVFVLSLCTDKLLPTPKMITFLPHSPTRNEKVKVNVH